MELQVVAADIGGAYIQAYTKEKFYTIAGPQFGKYAGQYLVIDKALYGLQTSGNVWHEKFSDNLRCLGFEISKAESDLWIKYIEESDTYDFVAIFVHYILVFSKKPENIIEPL